MNLLKTKEHVNFKKSIFDRWLDKNTNGTLIVLKKLGLSLMVLGPLLFVFGMISIIMAIYSFSLKAPADPTNNKIVFYVFISLYILTYIGIAIIGLFLIPAFRLLPKVKLLVSLVIYLSFLLIPSLALLIMGKWCMFVAKQSNNYQHTLPNDIQEEIQEHALENIPLEMQDENKTITNENNIDLNDKDNEINE